MDSIKCSHCGLTNLGSDDRCRRCGGGFHHFAAPKPRGGGPRDRAKKSSPLYTLLIIALLGGGAYYLYTGVKNSYDHIQETEAQRFAGQPIKTPAPLTSRTESDRRRAEPYKNAIANSQSISASDKRLAEAQKLMGPNAGNQQK